MRNNNELGIARTDIQQPWPSTKRGEQTMSMHRAQEKKAIDPEQLAAMKEVSGVMLRDDQKRSGEIITIDTQLMNPDVWNNIPSHIQNLVTPDHNVVMDAHGNGVVQQVFEIPLFPQPLEGVTMERTTNES